MCKKVEVKIKNVIKLLGLKADTHFTVPRRVEG